jgi:transposase-like protein
MLDDVVLARKTGAGALRRPVLVALGLRPDDKKEVIDFHLAASESAAEWSASSPIFIAAASRARAST